MKILNVTINFSVLFCLVLDKTNKWSAEWCCLQGLISKHPNTITVYRANNAATHFVTQLSQLWKYTSARTNMMKNLKLPTALICHCISTRLDDHSPVTVSARAAPLRRPHCSPPLVAVSASAVSPPRLLRLRARLRGHTPSLRITADTQIAGFRNFPQNNAMSLSAAGIFRLYNRVMMRSVQCLN